MIASTTTAPRLDAQQDTTVDSSVTVSPRHHRPDLTGSAEIGLFPTAMHYSPDVGLGGAWGGGMTVTLGYHISPFIAVEAAGPVTLNPSLNGSSKAAPNFYSATGAFILQAATLNVVQPYGLIGGGYDWYFFHTPTVPGLVTHLSYAVVHTGIGLRIMLGRKAALRAEVNTDVGSHRPSEAALFGVSFLPGGRARKPRIQRTVVTRQTTRVDTLRVTDTVHVHDTVTVSQVRTQVKVDTSVILVLQDVNFGFGKSALRPAAQPVLNRLAVQLNAPGLRDVPIEIRGYTDSIGSDSSNYKLGLARAQSVADYLVRQGVDQSRLTVSSGGKSDPVAPNSSAAGRARNRRVVIRRHQTSTPSGAGPG